MGQKVSPHGLRVGVIKDWNSKWFASKSNFADQLAEDNKIRVFVKKKLYIAGVSKVLIERKGADKIKVIVLTAKPGMVIGRSGNGIDELKAGLVKLTGRKAEDINISVEEVKRMELDSQLTAESIAEALERRVSFRRAMKQAIQRTMRANAKGIKVLCSGRLGGAEIARSEKYSEGNVPLHTLRADIDYGFAEADTTYGKIGVKVWINHGEILDKGLQSPVREEKREKRERRQRKDGDRRRNDRRRNDRNERSGKPEMAKAANQRVRKAPAKVEEPQVQEAPATETVEA
ncbi:MAG: 30S ribosomal protein S3 [Peptostreptococcaceae bacterium]|nr:30S ribosomal protein S3 [Peptostreptococcaceae bacterium]SFE30886.1 small subunit ribosomal protein S3 [Peptostreptococcaceae bacterium pGA-8]